MTTTPILCLDGLTVGYDGPPVKPDDYRAMAKLDALRYATPLEALAERFHMDEALLRELNPGVDFAQAGQRILVAAVPEPALAAAVATIEVDKTARQVRALDAGARCWPSIPRRWAPPSGPPPAVRPRSRA